MSNTTTLRLSRELVNIQKNRDQALHIYFDEDDIMKVRALLLGPPDTPYENGFFEFFLQFPQDYPAQPPEVVALTTDGGRTRFNPNIYSGGKVCLSILGTWRGEAGEQWSSAQGLESLLLSIQSLMNSNPFENEPGYDNVARRGQYVKEKESYRQKIRHETIRISVVKRLESYFNIDPKTGTQAIRENEQDKHSKGGDAFEDPTKLLFRYYYDHYVESIESEAKQIKEGKNFEIMPFESRGNQMAGKYIYKDLLKRLTIIKMLIDDEPRRWAVEGLKAWKTEDGVAVNLDAQFYQNKAHLEKKYNGTVMLELVDSNPFSWSLTYVGRPMTKLDGGLFRICFSMSPRFPEEQPRVIFETPIFHVHVTRDGVPYYKAKRNEDIGSHIGAIIDLLELEEMLPDPRSWMNSNAAQLYFGTEAQKREYRQKFRRAVQRSAEY
ncbi:ubiquitin-conjugating enzyme/RWD-like protein [Dipodascopsis uninucleata]